MLRLNDQLPRASRSIRTVSGTAHSSSCAGWLRRNAWLDPLLFVVPLPLNAQSDRSPVLYRAGIICPNPYKVSALAVFAKHVR